MRSLRQIHIPTLIALVLLLVGIGVGLFLVHQKQKTQTSASVETLPQELKLSNQTAFKGGKSEVTITWQTLKPTAGFILYGFSPNSLNFVSSDLRDKDKTSEGYYLNHYVELTNLPINKTIYYTVGVNNVGIGHCKNNKNPCTSSAECGGKECSPFSLTTPSALENQTANLAEGQVLDKNKQPLAGALVFISAPGSNLLSSLTDESGQWAINLSLLRQADLNSYFKVDAQASQLSLTAIYGQKKSQGKCLTANLNPAPPIILNQPYSCQKTSSSTDQKLKENTPSPSLGPTASPSASKQNSGFNVENNNPTSELELTNPSYEGEKIATSSPIIKGKGPQGKELKIIIHSDQEITANVYVDENGQWHWKPPVGLSPGEHTVTVSYTDDQGEKHKLVRHFYITSSGQAIDETPAYSASASAQTVNPTVTPTPTLTPTPTPSPTPIPPKTSMPSTSSGVPKSGSQSTFFLVLTAGLMLTIGSWLFYAQRKNEV